MCHITMARRHLSLSGMGRSCLAFDRDEMFGLGIALKEKFSRLFDPVSERAPCCVDVRHYVKAYNFILYHFMFSFIHKKFFSFVDNLSFKLYVILVLSKFLYLVFHFTFLTSVAPFNAFPFPYENVF